MTSPKAYPDAGYDIVVVGGGPAGLAAAVAASEGGAERVLIIEREAYLGGVLMQCVHDGFGLYLFGESLTGPEYARRWVDEVEARRIEIALSSTVTDIRSQADDGSFLSSFRVDVVGIPFEGATTLRAGAVICATGCRELTRGAMQIPGGRPAGVCTAGMAQYMMNVANQMPGDKVVIVGSGDIGLITARRLTLEGAEVRMVLGLEATGLLRNQISCIEDFSLPFRAGWGLLSVHGRGRLQGVKIAPKAADGTLDVAQAEYLRCNTLLMACGLIPEREVLAAYSDPTTVPGLFVCGNAMEPKDLVDQVSQESLRAGYAAADHVSRGHGARSFVDVGKREDGGLKRLRKFADRRIPSSGMKVGEAGAVPGGTSKRIVCTVCPTGCVMCVDEEGAVHGNGCVRGEGHARAELICPTRIFTGTVRLENSTGRLLLPVRTDKPVPQTRLMAVARACKRLRVAPPLEPGAVIVSDIAATGVALIACDKEG